MKKSLVALFAIASMFVMPVSVQAGDITLETAIELAAQDNLESVTKYTHGEVNIYAQPDQYSEVLGTSMMNTSFDVAYEVDGWSMILTESGVAFIETANLYSEESQGNTYTEHDVYLLAHLIAGEAQPCDDMEQRYVASVVLNRVADSRFPNSLEGVIFQKRQYACISDGNFYRTPTERNWMNARWILENGSILPQNVVWQSGGRQGKLYLRTKWHSYCY
mgnify:FL=1